MGKQPETNWILEFTFLALPEYLAGFGAWLIDLLAVIVWPLIVFYIAYKYKKAIIDILDKVDLLKIGNSLVSLTGQSAVALESPISKEQPENGNGKLNWAESLEQALQVNQNNYSVIKLESEKIQNDLNGVEDPKKIKLLSEMLAQNNFLHWCQRTYFIIYGTQIQFLKTISSDGATASQSDVKDHFNMAKSQYSAFYNTITMEQYVGFLTYSGLMRINNGLYEITDLGKNFITWVQNTGQNNKPF